MPQPKSVSPADARLSRAALQPRRSRIKLEICAASADDCAAAERGGADRIELNCALLLGGLTPSLGALREARAATRLPIIVMIRPRPGGFCYSPRDFRVMQRDAELALAEKADGIAFGILTAAGKVDLRRSRQIIKLAQGREIVFHRAFDVTPQPMTALEQLIDLGITRIMTSGQEPSASQGAANIARYIQCAAARIEILPAGGINGLTVADVVTQTRCNQVHASLTVISQDRSVRARPQVRFGGSTIPPEDQYTVTDHKAVTALRRALG